MDRCRYISINCAIFVHWCQRSPVALVGPPGEELVVVGGGEALVVRHVKLPHVKVHLEDKEGEFLDAGDQLHNGEGDSDLLQAQLFQV